MTNDPTAPWADPSGTDRHASDGPVVGPDGASGLRPATPGYPPPMPGYGQPTPGSPQPMPGFPQPAAGPYPASPYPYAAQDSPYQIGHPAEGLALLSLITGILSIPLCCMAYVLGPTAIIAGWMAMKQGPNGKAKAGFILGIVGSAIFVVYLGLNVAGGVLGSLSGS